MKNDFFATVANVYDDGISLIFDGQTEPSTKHYKYNSSISFSSGQRVKVIKISGTCVIEYPIN